MDGDGDSTEEEDPEEDVEVEMETSRGENPGACTEDKIRRNFFEWMRCWGLPSFGGTKDKANTKEFLTQLEARYRQHGCFPSEGLMMAECQLDGDAEVWWKSRQETTEGQYGGNVWEQFRCAFKNEYLTCGRALEEEEAGPSRKKRRRQVHGISGMIKVGGHPAYALFDTGSTHSHVDEEYAKENGLVLEKLQKEGEVMYTDGSRAAIRKVSEGCRINVGRLRPQALLMVTKIMPLDVLIGMDWLSVCHAHIDCWKGEIEFRVPGRSVVKFQGAQDDE